jgi:flavorubredoxin
MDEKITLFDTVKHTHTEQFLETIAKVVDPSRIDYIVVNHLELDHAGCLPELIAAARPEKIFCSPMGRKSMDSYFHDHGWPVETVATGDSISLGRRTATFLETRMLHWPDNMATYIPEDKLLVSSDAFGQNWATSERFADEVDKTLLLGQLGRYFANIVLPFSPIAAKVIATIEQMGLDIDMIVPDHGLMFRGDDVAWVFEAYKRFIAQKPTMKAVIAYDTMWHSTERMADAIADGLTEEGLATRLMSVKMNHHSDVMTEVLDAGAVVLGSPTHNNGILPVMADLLTYMKGLKPQNKVGGAFGSYGWSGEAVKDLTGWLQAMKFEVVEGQPRIMNRPTADALDACRAYGRTIGQAVKAKIGR